MLKTELIIFVTAAIMCLSGCKNDDILNKRQLEDILFEMHLSDGVVQTLANRNQIQNTDTIIRYKAIFEKYNCSRDKFEKSMRVYSRQKETINKIYDNIKLRFDRMLQDLESKDVQSVVKNIVRKFNMKLKNALTGIDKCFENVENINDFAEKLLNLQKDITENAEPDSADIVKKEEKLEKQI
jgi:DNA repair ATPase RecN